MKTPTASGLPLRIVAIGGGTGLPVVLRGLKQKMFEGGEDDRDRLAAIVTVTDDGGSSGRLRDELGMLPPGDVRNCLVALSHDEPLMSRVFQTRYRSRGGLDGHSLGNLILAGLTQLEGGNFLAAVGVASDVLNIHGRVYPSTLATARLIGTLEDGTTIDGESAIASAAGALRSIRIEPQAPPATPGVAEAIRRADIVVLGPGSLFTSIVPNLLIPELSAALRTTSAFRLLIVNAMTELGETTAFSAADHVRALTRHAGGGLIDAALLADDEIPDETIARYRAEKADRVDPEDHEIEGLLPLVFREHVLEITPKVRHDVLKTADAVLGCFAGWARAECPRCDGGASRAVQRDARRGASGRQEFLNTVAQG